MKQFGLIGYPLTHSFSKKYFSEKFANENISNHVYELIPIAQIDSLTELINENPSLCGLNVTIPYKVKVMDLLDEVDEEAAAVGAVNCIHIKRDGNKVHLKGYNTDIFGFEHSLRPLLQPQHTKALVLGNGGAAKAVFHVLNKLGISHTTVSRHKDKASLLYAELDPTIIESHPLIINTTPLGTYPDINNCPQIPYASIGKGHLLYDLVYNPEQTLFLQKGEQQGAIGKNGLEMLHLQAERAWQIWNQWK